MALAIFDLDNTLLAGDSDYLWGEFLVEQGLVDKAYYARENRRFYDEYKAGTLNIHEFMAFSLEPLTRYSREELGVLRSHFIEEKIEPVMLPAAKELLEKHRRQGDVLLIITATNRFVTEPIAEALGVDDLLATDPQICGDRYTGKVEGIPCFREGKVARLTAWLDASGRDLGQSWFYSDSHNDLPLLERVTHPVAVDPDETLCQHAELKGWPVISLRGNHAASP